MDQKHEENQCKAIGTVKLEIKIKSKTIIMYIFYFQFPNLHRFGKLQLSLMVM